MFQNYVATKADLDAIKEALRLVNHPKMSFVLKDKPKIKNVAIISYDSKFIYVWNTRSKLIHKIPHNLKISPRWQRGWWTGIISEQIRRYVPQTDQKPAISGGLLNPFIKLQKKKRISGNPYTTRESYLATIIHEFGHIYFGGYGKEGELPAFCTEYYASSLFWPKHAKKMDEFDLSFINVQKNLNDPHIYAASVGRKLIATHPKVWPTLLIKPKPNKHQPPVGRHGVEGAHSGLHGCPLLSNLQTPLAQSPV